MTAVNAAELLAQLTLEEKASLTAGSDMWTTAGVERLGIPAYGMTDGPNGARGTTLSTAEGGPTLCVPCGTALAASWDPALVERVGRALGAEARAKGARFLLAPTVNLHRAPLAGRNFECYSEDPLLSGVIAAGYVRGVQSQGVAAVVKHFVANEAETARSLLDSVVDERALRELYLMPFELAIRDGGALAIMTAYNRLNGVWCAEHEPLLSGILRGEWGFDGVVMTDWFGVGSTEGSLRAGLDLQMPGPARYFGAPVAEAIREGRASATDLDAAVTRLLATVERLDAVTAPAAETDPAATAREAAAAGMVLLRNDATLPLANVGSLAVIGPNADRAQIMGGGSSAVAPQHRTSPLAALRNHLPHMDIRYEPGCLIDRQVPALDASRLLTPGGEPGLAVEFSAAGSVVAASVSESTRLLYLGSPATGVPESGWTLTARAAFTPAVTGEHTVALSQVGQAVVRLDGQVVLDGRGAPVGGGADFFGLAGPTLTSAVQLTADVPVELVIEYSSSELPLHALHVGIGVAASDDILTRAVDAARAADVAVVVVGTTDEWESEGFDRTSLTLPGEQDGLIRAVAAANPRTVVVVNAGAPVTMPWREEVAAILVVWFGGQEMAGALAGVLSGELAPGGRLPTTLPERVEHTPSFGAFPGEDSQVRYGEGLLVGYRWYDSRFLPVAFPFGHGLSYTTFDIGTPRVSSATWSPGDTLLVMVPVRNTGPRTGSEVVQLYVEPTAPGAFRPRRELKAFAKVTLEPGESRDVVLTLDERAFARWDPGNPEHEYLASRLTDAGAMVVPGDTPPAGSGPGWRVDPGEHVLHVGRSIADLPHQVTVSIDLSG